MKTYIALLRGINVLGKNSLPMTELVALLEGIGGTKRVSVDINHRPVSADSCNGGE